MPLPEEVDEINEYLKARRKKQELGELPRQDLTPSFVKRMSNALFGEKAKRKVPLQSMQPTYASPVAQSAVRKQLDEIMQERTTKTIPATSPTPINRASAPSAPKALPPLPRYPESNVWASAAKPPVMLPPKTSPVTRALPNAPLPPAKQTPKGWGFWNKTPATNPSTNSPTNPGIPSYTTIAATPPKPYTEIPPLASNGPASQAKTFNPISSVRNNPVASTPATTNASAPIRAETTPTNPPTRTGYAPPWVTRTLPKPGISPALPSRNSLTTDSPSNQTQKVSPVELEKTEAAPIRSLSVSSEPNSLSPASSSPRGKPWVTGVLPREARDDSPPSRVERFSSSPAYEKSSSTIPTDERNVRRPEAKPFSFSSSGSGEVRADELTQDVRRNQAETPRTVAPPSNDAALREEISEEEAIDRLPFEEVEGLSESDLAYLERKEKEHAQTQDEALDQGDPASLRAHLEEQAQKLNATPPTPSEDPKKEILRRLKKMMDENDPYHQN